MTNDEVLNDEARMTKPLRHAVALLESPRRWQGTKIG